MIWLVHRPARQDAAPAPRRRRPFPAALIPSAPVPPAGGLPWLPPHQIRIASAAVPHRRRRRLDACLITAPSAEVLPIATAGQWSPPIDLAAGDEWRVTIDGPACTDPRVRIALRFRES